MKTEKILPETLLQLLLNVFEAAPDFVYKNGIQPFLMEIGEGNSISMLKIFRLHISRQDQILQELSCLLGKILKKSNILRFLLSFLDMTVSMM